MPCVCWPGGPVLLELALRSTGEYDKPSAPRADGRAGDMIRRLADMAAGGGLRVTLNPQAGFWMRRVEDAARLLMRINRPDVGVTFNLNSWLRTDGEHLAARLELALPRLLHVTIHGATKRREGEWTIEPMGEGSFDTTGLLGTLARMGYAGPVSFAGRRDGRGRGGKVAAIDEGMEKNF